MRLPYWRLVCSAIAGNEQTRALIREEAERQRVRSRIRHTEHGDMIEDVYAEPGDQRKG
jgi:hypothetical protein